MTMKKISVIEQQKMYCLIIQPRDDYHQFGGLFSSLEEVYLRYEEIMKHLCERYKNCKPELLKSKITDMIHFNEYSIYECRLNGPFECIEDNSYEYKQKVKQHILNEMEMNKNEQTKQKETCCEH